MPFVLFNTSLLEENNAVYDPNMINTNLLDVNYQNKFAFSAEQYFEGKLFEQNYSNYENFPENPNQNYSQNNKKGEQNVNEFSHNESFGENKQEEPKFENSAEIDKGNKDQNHSGINKTQNDNFKIPENVGKNKDEDRKRRSKFDQ